MLPTFNLAGPLMLRSARENARLTQLGVKAPGRDVVVLLQAAVWRQRHHDADGLTDVDLGSAAAQQMDADGGDRVQLPPAACGCMGGGG